MKTELTNVTVATLLLVLLILLESPYNESIALDIPTSTGLRGKCYDMLKSSYQEKIDRINRMEKKQVGELNEEREDWIERLTESWEEAPDLETTLNPLIIWAGAKIEEWTLEGILAFVNFVYDDAIESAQSEYVLPRLKVEKDTKAGYQFCVALPTSFSDEKEYYSEDEDENDQESKIDPDDSIEITQREEESDQYMDF